MRESDPHLPILFEFDHLTNRIEIEILFHMATAANMVDVSICRRSLSHYSHEMFFFSCS